ncbi:MFS transporter [Streptomyces sp. NPDC006193]|uniref:MFS transporter n=1 Tax=Streptomyces sp. NPDC006193 TaxID=3155717 RepID=UPI0033A6EEED
MRLTQRELIFGMQKRLYQALKGPFRHLNSRPLLLLSAATLVNTVGNGMFVATSILFFTHVRGIPPQQLGIGLTVAGIFGIVAGYPVGILADRLGTVRVLTTLLIAEGIGVTGYLFVSSFPAFLAAVAAVTFLDQGAISVRNALVYEVFPPAERLRGRAYIRAIGNAGTGLGAALAAIALVADTPLAYSTLIAVDAATFLITAGFMAKIRSVRPGDQREPHAKAGSASVNPLRNPPFVGLTLLSAILALHIAILQTGLPLWVTTATKAPPIIISGCLILNTALVILLQVRLSRGLDDPKRATTACFRSGVSFAVACAAFGCAAFFGQLGSSVLILMGAAVLTLGEIQSSAGVWSLSFTLGNSTASSSYQGVLNSGTATGALLGPIAVTSFVLPLRVPGWLTIAVLFFLAGSAFHPLSRATFKDRVDQRSAAS